MEAPKRRSRRPSSDSSWGEEDEAEEDDEEEADDEALLFLGDSFLAAGAIFGEFEDATAPERDPTAIVGS